jgi:succinate dehydrogenase/fumarate reductase-like Fe-S protein
MNTFPRRWARGLVEKRDTARTLKYLSVSAREKFIIRTARLCVPCTHIMAACARNNTDTQYLSAASESDIYMFVYQL